MKRWPHQEYAHTECLKVLSETPTRTVVCANTGAGKTRMMTDLIIDTGARVALYTHRRMLLAQTSEVLTEAGIDHGIRAAGYEYEREHKVQLCSTQTIGSRVINGSEGVHQADLIIIDEAHVQKSATMIDILERHANAHVIGYTATPVDIGHIYTNLIQAGTTSEMRACGALLACEHHGCPEMDIGKIQPGKNGDFSYGDIKKCWHPPVIFGNVLEHFLKLNPDRKPSILFAPGVAESQYMAEHFFANDIPAAHISGDKLWINGGVYESTQENRDMLAAMVENGDVAVVCNRFVMREGINWPFLAHLIFATPFGSICSYLQSGGRVLRNHPDLDRVCIARGTPILTDSGWIPIQNVTTADLIWDGVEWCSHNGACCNGVRKVIEWNGVTLTPDHKVLTHDGWKEAQEAKTGGWRPTIGAFGGSPVRTSDHSNPHHQRIGGQTGSTSRLWPVRKTGLEEVPQDIPQNSAWMRTLYAEIRQTLPRMAMASCPASASAVSEPSKQHVQPIWWEGNRVPLLFYLRSSMLDCEEPWFAIQERYDSRQDRQRRPLRAWESEVDRLDYPITQSRMCMESEISEEIHLCGILRQPPNAIETARTVAETDSRQVEVEVWDIANAGPRNRFCANGLIVANCIQDHGGNWWRHGSLNADRVWHLKDTANIIRSERMQRIREKKESEPITCWQCQRIRLSGATCPYCGFVAKDRRRMVIQATGKLKPMAVGQFKQRQIDTTGDLQGKWNRQYFRAKRSRNRMNFNQAAALYAMDNNWKWPPRNLHNMPIDPLDWYQPVCEVPMSRLT